MWGPTQNLGPFWRLLDTNRHPDKVLILITEVRIRVSTNPENEFYTIIISVRYIRKKTKDRSMNGLMVPSIKTYCAILSHGYRDTFKINFGVCIIKVDLFLTFRPINMLIEATPGFRVLAISVK